MGSRHVLGAHGPVGRSHLARRRPLPASGGQPGVSRVPRGTRGPGVTAHGTGDCSLLSHHPPTRGARLWGPPTPELGFSGGEAESAGRASICAAVLKGSSRGLRGLCSQRTQSTGSQTARGLCCACSRDPQTPWRVCEVALSLRGLCLSWPAVTSSKRKPWVSPGNPRRLVEVEKPQTQKDPGQGLQDTLLGAWWSVMPSTLVPRL